MNKISVMPTMGCNAGCGHCGNDEELKGLSMEEPVLEALLSEIKDIGIRHVVLTGGEVTNPGYVDILVKALRNSNLGEKAKINLHTNCWWGSSEEKAKDMLEKLAYGKVSGLVANTDSKHQEFIPLENVATVIKACEDSPVSVNTVKVTSYKSTYEADVEGIRRLAELLGEEITSTTFATIRKASMDDFPFAELLGDYKKDMNVAQRAIDKIRDIKRKIHETVSPSYSLMHSTAEGMMDVLKEAGGMDGLCKLRDVYYAIGDSEYSMLTGPSGINVTHNWAEIVGCAKKTVSEDDVMHKALISKVPLIHYTNMQDPAVMPDGSMLPFCTFAQINDRKRARLGVYPKTSLAEFEKRSNYIYTLGKVIVDTVTYLPALIRQ